MTNEEIDALRSRCALAHVPIDDASLLGDCSAALRALREERDALRSRLEIDPTHHIDGIYARDETIRVLEQNLIAARAEAAALRELLREARQELPPDVECNQPEWRDMLARIDASLDAARSKP